MTKRTNDAGFRRIEKNLKYLDKTRGIVGISGDARARKHTLNGKDLYEGGESLASIFEQHQIGNVVPKRPTHEPTMHKYANNNPSMKRMLANMQTESAEKNFLKGLVFLENKSRQAIIDLRSPANSRFTIAWKESSNPLVATGQMTKAVKAWAERK